jgi:deoxyribodipyrimidine photo-lyase
MGIQPGKPCVNFTMTAPAPSIVWFRQDLRTQDQAALAAAAALGPVLPVYVLDDAAPGRWAQGGASRWWLHHSLQALGDTLAELGAPLILLKGDAVARLTALAAATGARTVHALEHYEPWARTQQAALAKSLNVQLYPGLALMPPNAVRTQQGQPFKVFTPFWKTVREQLPPAPPAPAPKRITAFAGAPAGDALDSWGLLPTKPNWAVNFPQHWQPGESGAAQRLGVFKAKAAAYGKARDACADDSTSGLSAHLHFGEISPAQVWHGLEGTPAEPFLRQLGWRDFSLNLLLHAPDLADVNWRRNFDSFPWRTDAAALKAWQKGQTGYPMVDAGMRQLWQTGWMHNRVRMIAASFLIKHLMIDWREGEAWFWDTLVDADLANNAAGWQWTAGSGADAAPYFRIFNPISQGQRFDPAGAYVRRWCPELAKLPNEYIHAPWEAPAHILDDAGVALGRTWAYPIVNHALARARALAAYDTVKAA